MRILRALLVALCISALGGCATTEFKTFEGKDNLSEGNGGTKVIVDGMEI
jgi:hypothetical protein